TTAILSPRPTSSAGSSTRCRCATSTSKRSRSRTSSRRSTAAGCRGLDEEPAPDLFRVRPGGLLEDPGLPPALLHRNPDLRRQRLGVLLHLARDLQRLPARRGVRPC